MGKGLVWMCIMISALVVIVMSCNMTINNSWADEWWLLLPGIGSIMLFKWVADAYNEPIPTRPTRRRGRN